MYLKGEEKEFRSKGSISQNIGKKSSFTFAFKTLSDNQAKEVNILYSSFIWLWHFLVNYLRHQCFTNV